MSTLSDLWRGIQSGFDINKMKRDPLGSIAKIGAIYGLGATAYSAIDPVGAASASKWLKSGFGMYNTGPTGAPPKGTYGKGISGGRPAYGSFAPPSKSPKSKYGGFLERQVKGVGEFLSKPFDLGSDVNKWIKGDIDWNTVKKNNFGWLNSESAGFVADNILNSRSKGGGGGGGPQRKKVEHRDFRGNVGAPISANISNLTAGKTPAFAPGGISQALITGAITPESLAALGYRPAGVSAQEQNIKLEDIAKIKTTLTSAIG